MHCMIAVADVIRGTPSANLHAGADNFHGPFPCPPTAALFLHAARERACLTN